VEGYYKRFGMKNGKEDWIKGMSLLRNPVFIHINLAPGQPLDHTMYYAGSPHVSSNDSIIAVTTDDGMNDGAPDGIGLYDANTLSYLRSIDGGGGWGITLCGPIGAEVIVTNFSPFVLEFRRGQTTQIQRFHHNRNPHGIPIIGCETHLIALVGNTILLYRVTSGASMLVLSHTVTLGRDWQHNEGMATNLISWGEDKTHIVVFHCVSNIRHNFDDDDDDTVPSAEMCIYHLDTETDRLSLTLRIHPGILLSAVSLSDDFVIGCSKNKKIHVWDRHSSQKKPFILCDVEEDKELGNWNIIHPLHLSCCGHMLVSTSHLGCALCVWNISTGELLRKYNHAEEDRYVDLISDGGMDVCSMVHLKQLNAYLCTDGYMNIWSFPTNQSQRNMALSIRRREDDLRASNIAQRRARDAEE